MFSELRVIKRSMAIRSDDEGSQSSYSSVDLEAVVAAKAEICQICGKTKSLVGKMLAEDLQILWWKMCYYFVHILHS